MTSPDDSPQWYCVRTQTKREAIAASHLREVEEVDVFCPRLRYRKATRRGKIWWVEPMFPGYIMAKFKLAQHERTVTFCQGVRGLVKFGNEAPVVPASFVESLQHDLATKFHENEESGVDEETIILTPSLFVGDEVEVATGPLRGMQGTILEIAPAQERLKVLLEFLGQEQPVDIDLYSILLPRRPIPT